MRFSIEDVPSRASSRRQASTDSIRNLLSQDLDEEKSRNHGGISHAEDEGRHVTPSRSYAHLGGETQNQGNVIGERPCVRQSKIGRDHEGGNRMKDILGHTDLKWSTEHAEGAYHGKEVYAISVPLQTLSPQYPHAKQVQIHNEVRNDDTEAIQQC